MQTKIKTGFVLISFFLTAVALFVESLYGQSGQKHVIEDIPHVKQKPDFCGEACVSMAMKHYGFDISQDDVFKATELDPKLGRGAYTRDLNKALQNLGVIFPSPWINLPQNMIDRELAIHKQFQLLKSKLNEGKLSIVCMHYDLKPQTTEHFRLIVGYDDKDQKVYYHEPASSSGAYQTMPYDTFLKLWSLGDDGHGYFLVHFIFDDFKSHAVKKESIDEERYSLAQKEVIKKMGYGTPVVTSPPFVVTGNMTREALEEYTARVVAWSVNLLYKDFFTQPMKKVITIYLFKDDDSYRSYAWQIFGHKPSTPFGYYSASNNALIMNIGTGGGTLVHEIVHPLLRADFPDAPAWLDEGLGSLFEACKQEDGHIVGMLNWRLKGLLGALNDGEYVPIKKVITSTSDEFYDDNVSWLYYAESRYFLFYLQERGLLRPFYKSFVQRHKEDPSGLKLVSEVFGGKSIEDIEKDWLKWLVNLKK